MLLFLPFLCEGDTEPNPQLAESGQRSLTVGTASSVSAKLGFAIGSGHTKGYDDAQPYQHSAKHGSAIGHGLTGGLWWCI
jgi:hypothetical protein